MDPNGRPWHTWTSGLDGAKRRVQSDKWHGSKHPVVANGGVSCMTPATNGRAWTTLETWMMDIANEWLSEEHVEFS